jgi:phenylalanyl-tRNA synthetase beta chain
MKISYNWLCKYIKTDLPPQRISEILTNIGLEVEAMDSYENIKGGLKGIVVGLVTDCIKHPNADKLSLTKVDIGNGEHLNIVCGAPNVAAGQKVPVATIGTTLYKGNESFQIKETTIRGSKSQGMICAEDEIGLGTSHDGILVLDNSLKQGTLLSEVYDVYQDIVFEIGLTPNRVDAASHLGVARDLAAYLQHHSPVVLEKPSVDDFKVDNHDIDIKVMVENTNACPRYSGLVVTGIEIKPSPEWMQNSLKAIGLRAINNVVDITNYVMHELGHPLHAFDLAAIKGNKIIVKTLKEETPFVTLDGVERKLSSDDLMICNEAEPMCMAGVFGGLNSGVTEQTKAVFIESAYFNPVYIRRTARRHGLSTDSSFRFERGADPNITLYALKRAANLIKEIAGGKISTDIMDVYPKHIHDFIVELEYVFVEDIVGKAIPKDIIKEILRSLEIKIVAEKEKSLLLEIPTYRVDVTRPIDVVEDILRIYGFNEIEISSKVKSNLNYSNHERKEKWYNTMADLLTNNGFYEIMTNSLTKKSYYEGNAAYPSENCVSLLNPLSQDLAVMRQTLLYSGLESVAYNLHRQQTDVNFYEFGKCYFLPTPSANTQVKNYFEETLLALYMTGNKESQSWLAKPTVVNFFSLKKWVENILLRMNINVTNASVPDSNVFSYGLFYFNHNTPLVSFGKLHNSVTSGFDIKQEVFYAEFKWEHILKLASNQKSEISELPKYPFVRRDLALMIDKSVSYEQLYQIASKNCTNLLKEVNLFDVYEGQNIEQGKKSYALSFILQSADKTLTDDEINAIMDKLIKAFEKEAGAVIRM